MEWIDQLTRWYDQNARDLPWRHTRDPYKILVSEVMLQQTRVKAALGYYLRFIDACPDVYALSRLPEDELMKLWEGLGYYSRARNLKKAASAVAETWNGVFPADYQKLLSLPGVGPYTAGAVGSIAFGLKEPAVDGNVLRVMARINCDATPVNDEGMKERVRLQIRSLLGNRDAGKANQALMELGACVCLPGAAPECGSCPVTEHCMAFRQGRAGELPRRQSKKPRRLENKTVFVLAGEDGRLLGYKREDRGLLAGLWQLPDAGSFLTPEQAARQMADWGLSPAGEILFYYKKHVFTHIEWRMLVCRCRVRGRPPETWAWLDETKALPTAYRTALHCDGTGSASTTKRSGAGPTKLKG